MKRAELAKWMKANGVAQPFGAKTHELLRLCRESGKELPPEIEADMEQIVDTAQAKEKAVWAAAQGEEVEEVAPVAEVPSEAAVEVRKPYAGEVMVNPMPELGKLFAPKVQRKKDDPFANLFNSLEPGRGYTCQELTEMGGFGVTDAHFEVAVARDIAFPKSGGRWVRRPKNLGENLL